MRNRIAASAVATAIALLCSNAEAASYIVMGAPGAKLDKAVAAAVGVVTRRMTAIGAVVVDSASPQFAVAVAKQTGVQSVVPNLVIDWRDGTRASERVAAEEFKNPPNSGDNDTRFNLQWGHVAVNAVGAWNAGYRGAGARVAVLDGGFSVTHPDIAPNYDPSCSADMTGEGLAYGPNSDDPSGIFSHGMHVAGTIAAADNGFGIIGVAPAAKLCLVKVLYNYGSGSFENVAAGIIHAADQGVDVINMSLGGAIRKSGESGAYTAREAAELKNFIGRAVTYAYQKGALVVVSAGNEGINGDKDADLIHLPSDAPNAMSVSATAPIGWGKNPGVFLDNLASYSNYGRSVISVAAPGGDFLYALTSTSEACTVGGLTRPCYVFDYVFSSGAVVGSSAFFYWSAGTSMAAPHVSGVAALAVSRYGKMHPAQLRTIIERSADDLGQPGNDPAYGAGRVNAALAVQ